MEETTTTPMPALCADASPREIAEYAVQVLDQKKARNICLLHTEHQTSLADYFVICSGTSSAQLRALADEVEYRLSLSGITPLHTEGANGNGGWVLLDFGAVIVHVFSRDARQFYDLEKLYADNTECDISHLITKD